jgi:imidazolonepropionase-like amidohydrolase
MMNFNKANLNKSNLNKSNLNNSNLNNNNLNNSNLKKRKLACFVFTALAMATMSSSVNAQWLAITNATVHTATAQGILKNATVVIKDGKIAAINPKEVKAETTFDAKGRILTPGFIGSMNQLGLVEVGAVSRTRDAGDDKADITFDASLAFNPKSTVIAYSRKGGITSNVVTPYGGDSMFKGQAFVVDLSGTFSSVVETQTAVIIDLGAKSKGSRALALQALDYKLEDAQKALASASKKADKAKKDDKEKSEPKRDEKVINALLSGDKPLLAYADRATDLLALLTLKEKYSLDLILVGAADAVVVKEQIAQAKVPVIISAISNLPDSFDSLHNSLENSGILAKAGVKVILAPNGDTHNLYQLRFDAGNAVANGLSKSDALAAVTANIADVFDLNSGKIAVGKNADLVLWSADPFELSTKVDSMWINGKKVSTQSRQDALRKRYTTDSDMPRAYTR